MKRWEWFNKILGTNESLNTQALRILGEKMIDNENNPEIQVDWMLDCIKKWLNETVSNKD